MNETDSAHFQELMNALAEKTPSFDLFGLLRRVDALNGEHPGLGRSLRPRNERIRLGQKPSSSFAPSALADLDRDRDSQPAKLTIHGFGLFGPNGPMPLVLTEYVRERSDLHGDRALVEFFDLFHHRLISLFYRAWADAQSTNSLDRPEADSFTRFISSLLGLHGRPDRPASEAVPHHAYLAHAGHLARQVRNAEGLVKIIQSYFQVDARITEFSPRWLPVPEDQQTRLGGLYGSQLGIDAIAGKRVFDRQHNFRITLGPLTLLQYSSFLPQGRCYAQLVDWIQTYLGLEMSWEVTLVLKGSEVPMCQLGSSQQLGFSSWFKPSSIEDRADLTIYSAP